MRAWKILIGLAVAMLVSLGWSAWRDGGPPPRGFTVVALAERFIFVAGAFLLIEWLAYLADRRSAEKRAKDKRNGSPRTRNTEKPEA